MQLSTTIVLVAAIVISVIGLSVGSKARPRGVVVLGGVMVGGDVDDERVQASFSR